MVRWSIEKNISPDPVKRYTAGEAFGKLICPPAACVDIEEKSQEEPAFKVAFLASKAWESQYPAIAQRESCEHAFEPFLEQIVPGNIIYW